MHSLQFLHRATAYLAFALDDTRTALESLPHSAMNSESWIPPCDSGSNSVGPSNAIAISRKLEDSSAAMQGTSLLILQAKNSRSKMVGRSAFQAFAKDAVELWPVQEVSTKSGSARGDAVIQAQPANSLLTLFGLDPSD